MCSRVLLDKGSIRKKTWTPDKHCELHNYTTSELGHMLSLRHSTGTADMWFIGDSRVRRLWDMFVSLLRTNSPLKKLKKFGSRQSIVDKANFTYIWSPFLRGEGEWPGADSYAKQQLSDKLATIITLPHDKRPSFVFLGTAVWYTLHKSEFKAALKSTLQTLYPVLRNISLETDTKLVWIMQDRLYTRNKKVQKSIKDKYLSSYQERSTIITAQNEFSMHLLKGSGVYFWRSAHVVAELQGGIEPGSNHVSIKAVEQKARLLLNIYAQSIQEIWPSENLWTS